MGTFDYLRDYNPTPAENAGAAGGASPSPTAIPGSVPGAKEGLKLGSYDPAKGRRDAGTAPASFESDRGRGHNSYLREARADDQRTEDYFSAPVSFENFGDRYQQYMGSVAAMAGEYNRRMGSYQDPESAQAYADDSRKRMYQSNAQGRELWRFLTTNRDAVEKSIGAEGYASLTKSLMDAIGGTLDLSRGAAQNVDFLGSFANEGAFNAFRAYREEHPEEELGSAWQQSQADYFGGFEDRLKAAEQEYKEAREDYNRVLYSPEALNYDEAMSAAAARVTEAKDAYEKAKQENETRGYTEAQMAHRAELIGEYQKLQGKSKTAVTQEEIEQTRKDAARMLEIRQELERMDAAVGRVQDYSLMDRGTSVLTGTAKNLGSSLMNAAVTFADAVWNDRGDAFLSSAGEYELGGADVNALRQSIEKEFNDPVKRAKWNSIYAVADNLSESARMDLERAKGGLGWFGQAGVDIAENVLEMGFDAGMAALTGGGSLASMFLRTFGSSAQEARLAGADRSGQVAYGIAKGAIEVATEKLADGVAGIYGKGGADEITEELIRKMAGSRTGRTMLRLFAGAVGEGAEEVLSDVLSPLAERLYKNENLLELYKQLDPAEILYDFIIGAAIGGFGGTATLFNGQNRSANIELDLTDVGLGSRDAAMNDMWNALSGRLTPEQQQRRAERAQQRLGLTDEQLARARQGLQLGSWGTQQNESAAPEGTAERAERETPAPGNIIITNSGSGIIWAGSERAGETAGNPTQAAPEPTLDNAAGSERAVSGPPRASSPTGMGANTEGGMNHAEGQQSEQGILGQEEAQPAGGTDAGPGGEADINRERAEALEPAGLRAEGAGVSDGGRGRNAGARAGRAADRVDERTRRHQRREGEQGQRATARRRNGAALRERGEAQAISARELGIRNGTAEQNLTIVPGQAWDSEMRETAQRVYDETGYGVVYVIGAIRVQGADGVTHPVRGVIADDILILQADHSRTSITQLADHEIFHALVRSDPGLREAARQKVIERYTPEEFRRMMDSYLVNLGGLYGDMSTEQAAEIITEEILADAYADINFFGYGADRFGSAVREAAQERAGTQQAQGTQETRGPPERYSIDEEFADKLQKWYDDTKPEQRATSPGYLKLGSISDVLRSIGVRPDNIYMRKYKIGTILESHPEIDVDVIKRVPEILENPVLVMKSQTQPDSIVIFGDVKALNDDSVMAAVQLTPTPGGGTEAEFSLVTSAYGRSKENIQNLIKNSELLYLDPNKKRTNNWLMQLRVQFPSRQPPFGSIGTISYDDDGVNIQGKTLKDLGVEMTVAPDLDATQKTVGEIPDDQKTPMQKAMEEALRRRAEEESGAQLFSADDSEHNYSYESLISKEPMRVTEFQAQEVPIAGRGRKRHVNTGPLSKASLTGAEIIASDVFGNQKYVYIRDIDANVGVNREGVSHGVQGRITNSSTMSTAEVTFALPDILRNSVAMNELEERTEDNIEYSTVLFNIALRSDGKAYIVRSTVNHFADNRSSLKSVEIHDMLKGIKAKMIDASALGSLTEQTAASLPNTEASIRIKIADLLDFVKDAYPEYLSDSVREHYGIESKKAEGLRFSADDSEFDEAMPEDRELLLNAAARDGAHPEVTAWGKKQARIETLERKIGNLQEAMENADEEERAEMQPILDKAEGQLRRAREDAAKMEGSPILKRALDRERAAWREENPTEAAAAMRSLQQENKAMQEMVEYWKGQAKRTADTDRTVMPEDTRRMARNLLREHGSEASTDRIAGALQRLGNYIVSGEDLDFDRIMKEARGIAREILGSAYFFSDESREIREGIRDYLRQNRLKISDELRGDMADFADFRRRNMGTLRLANEGLPIDTAYMELQDRFGEGLFPSSVTAHADMLNQILNAMERVQPSYEKIYQKGRLLDEMVGHVANEIFDGLLSGEVRQSKTMADRQFEAMGRRNADLSERNQQLQDQLRGEKNMRRELVQEKVTELRQRSISKDKAYRKRVEIDKKVKRLSKSLIENSAKNHVPESMKSMLSGLLTSIDTLSPRSVEKARQDYIRRMNELEKVANKQQAYMNGAKNENDMFLDLPPDLGELLRQHMDSIQEAMDGDRTWTTAKMDLRQLEELDTILTVVSKAVTTANDLLADRRSGKVSEVASGTVKDLDKLGEVGADNMLTRFLQFQNTTPYYFFKRFGEGGQRIFRNLQEGWGKLAFNAREIIDYAEKTYTAKEARDAEKEIHEFKLSKRLLENDGGEELRSEERETVRLSKAQIMEIYALSRRPQALGHLLSAGIRIANIKQGMGRSIRQADNYLLTGEDLAEITGTLTEREKAIVDALQKHMNTVGSEWGNEVSMARYGIRQFTEENYWPIKTDSRNRDVQDPSADSTNLFRLLNMSFTKNTVRDAHNAIVIGSAFDTYANHMADMAKYNALGLPMLDAMKWFNYNNESEKNEAGQYTTASVQKSADRAFGEEAKNYFIQFMKDMNGTHEGGRDLEHFASRALSNYKVAAVGANLRVALLQPTAYVRAAAVLDPKYLVKGVGMSNKQGRAEAMKYSGTAVWKDLGFYDTNINTGLREMIKHTDSFVDTLKEKSMRAAEWGDKTTWGALWNACKAQVQETQNLKGEELMKATAELFDEVVYRTQVMDSTMTRSHNMRQKGVFAGMTTAFMAEPTLSYNMMLDAYNEFQTEKRKGGDIRKALAEAGPKVARSVAAYMATAAAAAIAESLMDAWRDDDKYQSFLDKWLEAMFGGEKITEGNLLQDLLIHNKLPFIKDFDNLINGYKSSRMDTEWMTNVVKTWQIWKETAELATGKLEKPTDITYNGKMTWYGKLYQTLKTASQLTGLPIGNAAREAVALWDNTVGQATGNIITTYDPGEKKQIENAVKDGYLSEEEAARYLMEQGVFDDESKAKAQAYKWAAEAQGEKIDEKQAAAVQALADTGTSTEEAVTTVADIWRQIEELTPREGSTSVAKTQRYAVVVNSDLSVEQQMSMLGVLMSEDELNKTETAYQYGITPQRYINNKTSMYEVSQKLSGDGQVSGEEAQIALEQNQSFSNEERAILWQLQNNGWAAENNPFDQEIGKRVYDAMHGGSSEGLTLGSANQQTAGSAAASADEGLRLGSSEEPKTGTWIPEAWDQPLNLLSW